MRSLILSLSVLTAAGCSWTSEGGITDRVLSKHQYVHESEVGSWNGEPIHIMNQHGTVEIVGVPGKTNLTMQARFVAGANSEADAEAAFEDMAQSALHITSTEGGWTVSCDKASAWHGSVDPESTGCTFLRIEVPAGEVASPLSLAAYTNFGGIHASGLTVSSLDLQAPFGLVADVTPTSEASIRLYGEDLVSGMCSSILRVPSAATLGVVALSVQHPELEYAGAGDDPRWRNGVEITGFSDAPSVPARTGSWRWSRGEAPFDAAQVEIRASLGKAVLTTAAVPSIDDFNQCQKQEPISETITF